MKKIFILTLVATFLPCSVWAERPTGSSPAVRDMLTQGETLDADCASLVVECLAYQDPQYGDCLMSASRHPYCAEESLGKLAQKRWSMNPNRGGFEEAPALTGPKLINKECLKNFDGKFSAVLVAGSLSTESIQELNRALDQCNQATPEELMRP